jgi:ABC-type uncharacterized transport system permease subunit
MPEKKKQGLAGGGNPGCAVLVALLVSGLLMAAMGYDPFAAFAAIARGSFGSVRGLINTITVAIPLLIVALGLSISFTMRFWNIGGEGHMIMGAIFATYVDIICPCDLTGRLWPSMALAGDARRWPVCP